MWKPHFKMSVCALVKWDHLIVLFSLPKVFYKLHLQIDAPNSKQRNELSRHSVLLPHHEPFNWQRVGAIATEFRKDNKHFLDHITHVIKEMRAFQRLKWMQDSSAYPRLLGSQGPAPPTTLSVVLNPAGQFSGKLGWRTLVPLLPDLWAASWERRWCSVGLAIKQKDQRSAGTPVMIWHFSEDTLVSAQSPFATPWTVTCRAPLSMGFSRQHWNGLPFPPPGDIPDPRIKSVSPALASRLSLSHLGSPEDTLMVALRQETNNKPILQAFPPGGFSDLGWMGVTIQ